MGVSLWVVSTVGWALKGEDQVIGVDDGDVLVVVEGAVESIGKEVGEDKMVSLGEGEEERGGEGREGEKGKGRRERGREQEREGTREGRGEGRKKRT